MIERSELEKKPLDAGNFSTAIDLITTFLNDKRIQSSTSNDQKLFLNTMLAQLKAHNKVAKKIRNEITNNSNSEIVVSQFEKQVKMMHDLLNSQIIQLINDIASTHLFELNEDGLLEYDDELGQFVFDKNQVTKQGANINYVNLLNNLLNCYKNMSDKMADDLGSGRLPQTIGKLKPLFKFAEKNNANFIAAPQYLNLTKGSVKETVGLCAGYVLLWIKQINKYGKGKTSFVYKTELSKYQNEQDKIVKERFEKLTPKSSLKIPLNAKAIDRFIPNDDSIYYITLLNYEDIGHAIGVRKIPNTNQIEFLEPNIGLFVFPDTASFKNWLPHYLLHLRVEMDMPGLNAISVYNAGKQSSHAESSLVPVNDDVIEGPDSKNEYVNLVLNKKDKLIYGQNEIKTTFRNKFKSFNELYTELKENESYAKLSNVKDYVKVASYSELCYFIAELMPAFLKDVNDLDTLESIRSDLDNFLLAKDKDIINDFNKLDGVPFLNKVFGLFSSAPANTSEKTKTPLQIIDESFRNRKQEIESSLTKKDLYTQKIENVKAKTMDK